MDNRIFKLSVPHLAQKKRELESVGSVGNCQIEREDHTLQFLSSSSQGVWNVGHSPSGIEESRLYCMANKDTYILGGVVMSLFGVGRGSQFSQGGGCIETNYSSVEQMGSIYISRPNKMNYNSC